MTPPSRWHCEPPLIPIDCPAPAARRPAWCATYYLVMIYAVRQTGKHKNTHESERTRDIRFETGECSFGFRSRNNNHLMRQSTRKRSQQIGRFGQTHTHTRTNETHTSCSTGVQSDTGARRAGYQPVGALAGRIAVAVSTIGISALLAVWWKCKSARVPHAVRPGSLTDSAALSGELE